MATKEQVENLVYNNALKEYRFTLSEASEGVLVLYHAPDGWMDSETTYSRHKTYGSVLRNVSTNELTFYKEGRDFIKNVYENTGIDANITLTVEKLDKSTNTYASYPSASKVDLSTYMVNEIGVSVQMIDTSFKEKLINRDTTEVDILKDVSIEGLTPLTAYTVDELTFPDTSVTNLSSYDGVEGNISALEHICRIVLISSTFSESQTPDYTVGITNTDGAFYKDSTEGRLISINGTFAFNYQFIKVSPSGTLDITITLRKITSGGTIEDVVLLDETYTSSGINTVTFELDTEVYVGVGDSLLLFATQSVSELGTDASVINYRDYLDFNADELFVGNRETTITAIKYKEAFLRIVEMLTDRLSSFESTFLTSQIGFLTKGIYFRTKAPLSEPIPLKLKDLFDSLNSIFRLGMGVEKSGGVETARIEQLEYFFDSNVILDISDRIRVEDIEKRVIPEMFYKSCEVGYNKAEYENNSGLLEFNTKSTWSTVIKSVFNEFRQISKYRADGQGMRKILNAPYKTNDNGELDYDPSEDVKGDDDIFLIDALLDGVYKARTNEGFDSITGSVYADSSYNVLYSPARMLRNWGATIRAGLENKLNTVLRWQSTEKNTTLASKLTTESTAITENEDILINDLNDPIWYNEKYVIEAPLTVAELQTIDANPNGLVKLDTNKYGWILELKTKNKDGMAEFELLRTNLNNVTPI